MPCQHKRTESGILWSLSNDHEDHGANNSTIKQEVAYRILKVIVWLKNMIIIHTKCDMNPLNS